jgi:hypothetical protein
MIVVLQANRTCPVTASQSITLPLLFVVEKSLPSRLTVTTNSTPVGIESVIDLENGTALNRAETSPKVALFMSLIKTRLVPSGVNRTVVNSELGLVGMDTNTVLVARSQSFAVPS